ncbi:MAG: hypothetical protein IPG71_05945 [bacterium]|nr:hypothetical protein [bacterium]
MANDTARKAHRFELEANRTPNQADTNQGDATEIVVEEFERIWQREFDQIGVCLAGVIRRSLPVAKLITEDAPESERKYRATVPGLVI